jgi:mono/diheme cytochrome c family protein
MRARRLLPLLLVLGSVALVATGCFESEVASTTITGPVTIGQGTTAKVADPGEGASNGETTTEEPGSTAETSTEETMTTAESTGGTTGASTGGTTGASTGESTGETTTGGTSGADLAAGKTAFVSTCGGCHALKDAGTAGNVGPDLDSLAPLTAETVANQIKNGGGAMPPKLLQGADAANVAAYVASVAGK